MIPERDFDGCLVYLALIHAIKTNSGIGFVNNDQGRRNEIRPRSELRGEHPSLSTAYGGRGNDNPVRVRRA